MVAAISQIETTTYISNRRAQKVHVVGPHLLDGSLPYEARDANTRNHTSPASVPLR